AQSPLALEDLRFDFVPVSVDYPRGFAEPLWSPARTAHCENRFRWPTEPGRYRVEVSSAAAGPLAEFVGDVLPRDAGRQPVRITNVAISKPQLRGVAVGEFIEPFDSTLEGGYLRTYPIGRPVDADRIVISAKGDIVAMSRGDWHI